MDNNVNIGMAFVSLFAAALIIVLAWVVPITYGIQAAIRKHYSPHWMWFGIHPIGGWIAFTVLSFLPTRVECQTCGGFISPQFRICPYCRMPMGIGPQRQPMTQNRACYAGGNPATTYPTSGPVGSPMVDDQPVPPAGPTTPTY